MGALEVDSRVSYGVAAWIDDTALKRDGDRELQPERGVLALLRDGESDPQEARVSAPVHKQVPYTRHQPTDHKAPVHSDPSASTWTDECERESMVLVVERIVRFEDHEGPGGGFPFGGPHDPPEIFGWTDNDRPEVTHFCRSKECQRPFCGPVHGGKA